MQEKNGKAGKFGEMKSKNMKSWPFDERLNVGHKGELIMLPELERFAISELRQRRTTLEEQRSGKDYVFELKYKSFDVKVRDHKWCARGDILLETFSVVEKKILGWTDTSTADGTIYCWWNANETGLMPTYYLIRIQDKRFKDWWGNPDVRSKYEPKMTQTSRNDNIYHTEFIIVPISDFPEGVLERRQCKYLGEKTTTQLGNLYYFCHRYNRWIVLTSTRCECGGGHFYCDGGGFRLADSQPQIPSE